MAEFDTVYAWTGASGGDWSDNVHNWTPGYPVASPPGYGDLTIFNNGIAETVAGNGSASEADVVLGTTLTIMDSLSLDGAVTGVGLMVDSGGKVIVGNGATKPGVPTSGDVSVDVIGFTGVGALDVGTGGGLDDTGMVLGDRSTGSGTLTVEGIVIVAPAAAPNGLLIVGNAGSGVVTIQNGGALSAVTGTVLGFQSGSNGTATLTGAGSTWLAGALTVGQAGTGSLTVRNGGVLTTTNGSIIGFDDPATGVHGTGGVTIEAGGMLNALTSLGIGSLGTFRVNDGTASARAITLSGGTVVVSNAGTVTTQTLTMAGGMIDVSNGGLFVDGPAVIAGTAGTVLVEAGANVNALGTIIGHIQLNGELLATGSAPGLLKINGDITGGGILAPLMTLEIFGVIGAGVDIAFSPSVGAEIGDLVLDAPTGNQGTITGFGAGNMIDIQGSLYTDAVFTQGTSGAAGTLTLSGVGYTPLALAVEGNYGADSFVATPGTSDTIVTLCFAAGTRIATPHGEVPVERLAVGDKVLTLGGDVTAEMLRARDIVAARLSGEPIRWIGQRRIDLTLYPKLEAAAPIRIQRGALRDEVPARDLLVSPDHAIYLDGVLICARQLINGTTIRQETGRTVVDYYHVELDKHAILFAEGLPAESYLDTGNRSFFANSGAPLVLYPDLTDASDYPTREAGSCAPFIWDEASVQPVWQCLADRAAATGRPVPQRATTADADLRLLNKRPKRRIVKPIYGGSNLAFFMLPRGASEIRLLSRAQSPTEARPWLEDRRRLGVCVKRIVLRTANEVSEVPVDHTGLTEGWWAVERDGQVMSRWTDGDAVLPLPAMSADGILEIHLAGSMTYVVDAVPAGGAGQLAAA